MPIDHRGSVGGHLLSLKLHGTPRFHWIEACGFLWLATLMPFFGRFTTFMEGIDSKMNNQNNDPDDPWYLPNPLDVCPPSLRHRFTPEKWAARMKEILDDWAQLDAEEKRRRRLTKKRTSDPK
jgi:hypothetical protein